MEKGLDMDQDAQQVSAELQPILVVVSGMPATGKSTLAEQLAERLGWPAFTKDTFKEILFDAAGHDAARFDEAASDLIGTQFIALLLHLAETLVTARVNVVLEGNFRTELAARDFAIFLPCQPAPCLLRSRDRTYPRTL